MANERAVSLIESELYFSVESFGCHARGGKGACVCVYTLLTQGMVVCSFSYNNAGEWRGRMRLHPTKLLICS